MGIGAPWVDDGVAVEDTRVAVARAVGVVAGTVVLVLLGVGVRDAEAAVGVSVNAGVVGDEANAVGLGTGVSVSEAGVLAGAWFRPA